MQRKICRWVSFIWINLLTKIIAFELLYSPSAQDPCVSVCSVVLLFFLQYCLCCRNRAMSFKTNYFKLMLHFVMNIWYFLTRLFNDYTFFCCLHNVFFIDYCNAGNVTGRISYFHLCRYLKYVLGNKLISGCLYFFRWWHWNG